MSSLSESRPSVERSNRVTRPSSSRRRYVPLLQRVAALNVLLVLAAVAITVLVLAPRKLSSFAVDEEVAVIIGTLVLVVLANVYLVRRLLGPVQSLTALARRVDLTSPAQRMPVAEPNSEAGELALTFNEMLERLQRERREATGRILAAQEAERLRIARELHDQVGQELTAVLLGLARIGFRAPDELNEALRPVQDVVRATLEDVRRIVLELRPEALDELGLASALGVLAERFSERLGLNVTVAIASGLPPLSAETELVVYRVAQEALTNVARHSGACAAELDLAQDGGRLALTVRDHGRGLPPGSPPGSGIRGMRERARLIGARLEVRPPATGSGCEVHLEVPLEGLP